MAKHQTASRNINEINIKVMTNRLNKMINIKNEYIKRIETEGWETVAKEMKIQKGNAKTGNACWTVSLIPVHDCPNCSECYRLCYDLRNDCQYPAVLNDRARNSALRETNLNGYWKRVSELVTENCITELRLNVGGDLCYNDFVAINEIVARENDKTDILFFTKNYADIDRFLDEGEFFANVHPIRSCWIGMESENKHNMPCSHVLFADGRTTAPEFGSYYCQGNCTKCHFKGEGCWTLNKGEDVVFLAH